MWIRTNKLNHDLSALSSLHESSLKELDTEKVKHQSTISLLEEKNSYSSLLEQQISDLKVRPEKIKYIVRTETILESSPTITVKEIPPSYTFRLKNGLAVAGIENKIDHYDLLTYDLILKGQVAITDGKANATVHASSSEDPTKEIEVPVELTVINTEPRMTIEPHIGVALTAGYPWNVSGAIWSTFVHFPNSLDVGGVALMANDQNLSAGLIPVAYNIGTPMPVLTNVWVAPLATINILGQPGAAILLGGKL